MDVKVTNITDEPIVFGDITFAPGVATPLGYAGSRLLAYMTQFLFRLSDRTKFVVNVDGVDVTDFIPFEQLLATIRTPMTVGFTDDNPMYFDLETHQLTIRNPLTGKNHVITIPEVTND